MKPAGDLCPSGETGRISECSDVVAALVSQETPSHKALKEYMS